MQERLVDPVETIPQLAAANPQLTSQSSRMMLAMLIAQLLNLGVGQSVSRCAEEATVLDDREFIFVC